MKSNLKVVPPAVHLESGIPIPRITRRGKGGARSPIRLAMESMEVGQSFSVVVKSQANVNSFRQVVQRKTGRKFTIRRIEGNQYRVWRIA